MSSRKNIIYERLMGSELELGLSRISATLVVKYVNKVLIPKKYYPRPSLMNQAKFEVDGHLPEYKTPECLGPRELALHEATAIDLIGSAVLVLRADKKFGNDKFSLHKSDRNCEVVDVKVDVKYESAPSDFYCPPNSFGSCHSNYLTYRQISPEIIKRFLTHFLLTRWICIGNIWVEIGSQNELKVTLSQRAGLIGQMYNTASIGATRIKPLISTKDEPLANDKIWRRYHDVSGNQNMSEWQTYLKHATMDLMFMMIESPSFLVSLPPIVDKNRDINFYPNQNQNQNYQLMKTVDFFNADIFGERTVRLADGRNWSTLNFQRYFISEVERYKKESRGPFNEKREKALQFWIQITDAIERKDLVFLARYLDWAAILYYYISPALNRLGEELESIIGISKKGIPYDREIETKKGKVKVLSYIHNIIIEYANMVTENSPYGLLIKKGLMEKMFSPEEILHAKNKPPAKTRAACREELMLWVKEQPNMTIFGEGWGTIVVEEYGKKINVIFNDPYCPHIEKPDSIYSHYNPRALLASSAPYE